MTNIVKRGSLIDAVLRVLTPCGGWLLANVDDEQAADIFTSELSGLHCSRLHRATHLVVVTSRGLITRS